MLSEPTRSEIMRRLESVDSAERSLRAIVVAGLRETSFRDISQMTGLSTSTLQSWKRDLGRPIPERYEVKPISSSRGKEFVIKHHYSHGIHNGPMCWGLHEGQRLVGVIAFATPSSENVRVSIFGEDHKDAVTELHRLVVLDETPKNTESYFIAAALRMLKERRPQTWGVLSFADASEGHMGTIYQATNALYCGASSKTTFFVDQDGRLRHPRQNGRNITASEVESRGWTPVQRTGKHRYLFLTPDNKGHGKALRKKLLLTPMPYPMAERFY